MKETTFKVIISTAFAGLAAYMQELFIPIVILAAVMLADYVSGIVKAWVTKQLNSRIGLIGIIKKLGYLLVVCVGMAVDWVIDAGIEKTGIDFKMPYVFGLIVVVWLIVNELISILENLGEIGVPLPAWLLNVANKLKNSVDDAVIVEGGGAKMSNEINVDVVDHEVD